MPPNPKRLASFQSVNQCYLVSLLTYSFSDGSLRFPFALSLQLSISMLPAANP